MKRLLLLSLLVISLGLLSAIPIYDVQYSETPGADGTYPSPYGAAYPAAGQVVTVTGVVTNNTYGTTSGYPTSTKFFISDPAGGPWNGLYIYVFGSGANVGDMVTCTGPIQEYYGMTEMIFVQGTTTVQIQSSGNPLPAPMLVSTNLMPINSLTVAPPNSADAEPYESCLVKVVNVTATTDPDTHREFYVNDGSGPGQVDDGCYLYGHSWTGIATGSHWDQITGIMDYSYNMYGLNPRNDADMIETANEDQVFVLPDAYLIGNYPNPCARETAIAFNLKSVQPVQIQVFNLKGQKVRTLVDGRMSAQLHNVTFDGKDDRGSMLPSGVYMYKLTAGNIVQSRKLVIR